MLFFYSATFVLANPPGSPYQPGVTLDPSCAPGDTNCSVTVTAAALADGSIEVADFSATGTPSSSTYLRGDNTWATISGGSGTVTSVSVVTANGFAGSVATATTTPAITITTNVTGLLKGNGTAISAASAGTDYESPLTFSAPLARATNTVSIADAAADDATKGAAAFAAADFNASSGVVSLDYTNGQAASGSSKGFLTAADWTTFNNKGNGTVTSVSGTTNRITSTGGATPVIDISASYAGQASITTLGTIGTGTWQGTTISPTYGGTGINNGSNTITLAGNLVTTGAFNTTFAASATGTYTLPSATSTLLANNLGISGGSTLIGGTASDENLTLTSTSNATKGKIIFGSASVYDEVNDRFGITQTTPTAKLHINTNSIGTTTSDANGILLQNTTAAAAGAQQQSPGIVFDSFGWKTTATAASQQMKWRISSQPKQGTSAPTNWLVFQSSVNGAAYTSPFIFEGATGTLYGSVFDGAFRTVTGGTANFSAFAASTIGSISVSLAGSTNTSYRTAVIGSTTGTITASNSYAGFAVLGSAATIAASGTHPLFAAVAIKPITITAGAGTLTNSATLYVQDAATGATNNYAIWSAAGANKFDGTTTLADTTISDSTPTLSNAGFNSCTSLTTVSNVVTCTISDRTVKTNLHDFNDGLAFIRNIQPKTYSFKEGTQYFDNNRERLGLIAQEVEASGLTDAVLPIGNGLIQIDFNAVTAASISAIKSLDLQVQALPVLQNQSLAEKIADFLRSIAENGIAIVDRLKTRQVQTQELCLGEDSDQVCVTKDQLRVLLGQQSPATTVIEPDTVTTDEAEEAPEEPIETTEVEEEASIQEVPYVDEPPTATQSEAAPDPMPVEAVVEAISVEGE